MSGTKSFAKIKKIKLTQIVLLVLITAIFLFLLLLINGCKIDAVESMWDKPFTKAPTLIITSIVQAQNFDGVNIITINGEV